MILLVDDFSDGDFCYVILVVPVDDASDGDFCIERSIYCIYQI